MGETTEKYPIPEIRKDGRISTLYVKGEPFFALSGEIHNSSASSLDYMEEHVWKQVEDMHLNSLIVPLYWESIEPEEGQYDFTLPDGLIRQARKHQDASDLSMVRALEKCRIILCAGLDEAGFGKILARADGSGRDDQYDLTALPGRGRKGCESICGGDGAHPGS